MLTFLLQGYDSLIAGRIYLFAILFLAVTLLWLARIYLSKSYTPWTEPYNGTVGVLIPVVDEPEELFSDVLRRITEQKPDEVIVVINGERNETLEKVCESYNVPFIWTTIRGKRNAIREGIEHIKSDIVVLVDSDTVWTDNTLSELVKPFVDPEIGGVTTRQQIFEPGRSVLTRWANWLESVRIAYSMPAMSETGSVGCLPGRTIALRREIITKNLEKFLSEKFLGVYHEISDDRTLTNYALKDGWKTVYQDTSLVYTDAPTDLKKLAKQQYRWARGSQYNTMRMMVWMVKNTPWLAVFYLSDILIPFLVVGVLAAWLGRVLLSWHGPNVYLAMYNWLGGDGWALTGVILSAILLSWAFAGIRFMRVLKKHPKEFFWMPVYLLINTFFLIPVRLYGFFRSAHIGGWGTRQGAYEKDGTVRQPLISYLPYLVGTVLLVGLVSFGLFLYTV